ncbi:hypothetical protein RJT34_17911 [Clitoria ternatea]|uniref:Cryptochrome/DNA photolyase FAD-binding domain-containing protein n=1 Tax=Clitoria ternatea TaxID=43366 RepID=A0AAN9PDQ8_CLITE
MVIEIWQDNSCCNADSSIFTSKIHCVANFEKPKGNCVITTAFGTPNFEAIEYASRTGFPWIDAIMIQFVHWEKGRDVFERLLIDSNWAINNGNWMWLSSSSFFCQYNRIYSPTTFGKKYDPNGDYIRHFLPVLKDMPREYIYEPWTTPLSIQTKAKCIVGKDYPMPVVSYDSGSKECRRRVGEAYALNKGLNDVVSVDDLKNLRRKLDKEGVDSVLIGDGSSLPIHGTRNRATNDHREAEG